MSDSAESLMFDKQQPHSEHGLESPSRIPETEPSHSVRRLLQILAVTALLAVSACTNSPGSQSGNRQLDADFSTIPLGVGVFGGR